MKYVKQIMVLLMIFVLCLTSTIGANVINLTYAEEEDDEGDDYDENIDYDVGTSVITPCSDGSKTMTGSWKCGHVSFEDAIVYNNITINAGERINVRTKGWIKRSSKGCTASNTFYIIDGSKGELVNDVFSVPIESSIVRQMEGYRTNSTPLQKDFATETDKGEHIDGEFTYITEPGTHNISIQMVHIKHQPPGGGATNNFELNFSVITEKYTVLHFDANGGTGSVPPDVEIGEVYGSDIGSDTPERAGYDFRGWGADTSWCSKRISYLSTGIPRNRGNGGSASTVTAASWTQAKYAENLGVAELGEERTVYAQWDPKEIPYTVKHFKMNLEGEYETEAESITHGLFEKDELTGYTDDILDSYLKDYRGFTAPASRGIALEWATGSNTATYMEDNGTKIVVERKWAGNAASGHLEYTISCYYLRNKYPVTYTDLIAPEYTGSTDDVPVSDASLAALYPGTDGNTFTTTAGGWTLTFPHYRDEVFMQDLYYETPVKAATQIADGTDYHGLGDSAWVDRYHMHYQYLRECGGITVDIENNNVYRYFKPKTIGFKVVHMKEVYDASNGEIYLSKVEELDFDGKSEPFVYFGSKATIDPAKAPYKISTVNEPLVAGYKQPEPLMIY